MGTSATTASGRRRPQAFRALLAAPPPASPTASPTRLQRNETGPAYVLPVSVLSASYALPHNSHEAGTVVYDVMKYPQPGRWEEKRMLCRILLVAALVGLASSQAAYAVDTIRVGKSVPIAWTFTPLDMGVETGIWAKHGSEGGDLELRRRRQGAASACSQRRRFCARQRAGHGLRRQGSSGQGGRGVRGLALQHFDRDQARMRPTTTSRR